MAKVIWTKAALADVEGYKNDLEAVDPGAAMRSAQMIRRAGDSLESTRHNGSGCAGCSQAEGAFREVWVCHPLRHP